MSSTYLAKDLLSWLARVKISQFSSQRMKRLSYSNANSPWLTPIGPFMWQAEADAELTRFASPAIAVGINWRQPWAL